MFYSFNTCVDGVNGMLLHDVSLVGIIAYIFKSKTFKYLSNFKIYLHIFVEYIFQV